MRYDLEEEEEWFKHLQYFKNQFNGFIIPKGFHILSIPPFGGDLIRLIIRLDNKNMSINDGLISIYFDSKNALGYMDQPYYEIYSIYMDQPERFYVNEFDKMNELINKVAEKIKQELDK